MKKKGGMKNNSRSKSSKQKQSMTTKPFPNNCGEGSGNATPSGEHQWGSGVKHKNF